MKLDNCGGLDEKVSFFSYKDSMSILPYGYIGRYSLMITLDKLKLTVGVKNCW